MEQEELINKVIDQIKEDIENYDVSAIEVMLQQLLNKGYGVFTVEEILKSYLSEE